MVLMGLADLAAEAEEAEEDKPVPCFAMMDQATEAAAEAEAAKVVKVETVVSAEDLLTEYFW